MFECALAAGLTASGADTYTMHVTSTPSVAYITRIDDFDCGIMISASHNPYHDNGIKLINANGEKMEESVIDLVEQYLDGKIGPAPYASDDKIGMVIDYSSCTATGISAISYLLRPTHTRVLKSALTAQTAAHG